MCEEGEEARTKGKRKRWGRGHPPYLPMCEEGQEGRTNGKRKRWGRGHARVLSDATAW